MIARHSFLFHFHLFFVTSLLSSLFLSWFVVIVPFVASFLLKFRLQSQCLFFVFVGFLEFKCFSVLSFCVFLITSQFFLECFVVLVCVLSCHKGSPPSCVLACCHRDTSPACVLACCHRDGPPSCVIACCHRDGPPASVLARSHRDVNLACVLLPGLDLRRSQYEHMGVYFRSASLAVSGFERGDLFCIVSLE